MGKKRVVEEPKVVKLEKLEPVEVTDLDIAFPADVRKLMPLREEIPDSFRFMGNNPWMQLASDLFYKGGNLKFLKEKEGINKVNAIRHVKSIMGSYQPKHEHKMESIAYLMSLWFEPMPDNWKEQATDGVE